LHETMEEEFENAPSNQFREWKHGPTYEVQLTARVLGLNVYILA